MRKKITLLLFAALLPALSTLADNWTTTSYGTTSRTRATNSTGSYGIQPLTTSSIEVPKTPRNSGYSSSSWGTTSGRATGYDYNRNKTTYTGPKGGNFYINDNRQKNYYTPDSTVRSKPIYSGENGGRYYINKNGNKTYIKRKNNW